MIYIIADMHCDTIYKIRDERKKGNVLGLKDGRNLSVNLEKMKAGNYLVQNFAVFIDQQEHENPYENAMELVRIYREEMENNSDRIRTVKTREEILKNAKEGILSAMLTLEEGGMCMGDVEKLQEFYEYGARMMALSWNYENELCYSAAVAGNQEGFGLKKKGFEFLEVMEEIGMIPDVSHLSDEGFYDLLKVCKKPFAASHSNARTICGHRRNLTDDMIRQIGERGGVIGLNFYPEFLGENLKVEECLDVLAQHAIHMIRKGGIECVGLGSDFDGFAGEGKPADAEAMEELVWTFHKAGFTADELDKIMWHNVMRLYGDVLK